MNRRAALILVAAVAAAIGCAVLFQRGCAGTDHAPSPRPRGFARMETYPDSMTAVEMPGAAFGINAAATLAQERPNWLTATFPRYNATLYVTSGIFTDTDSLLLAMANRSERISLNLAGRRARVEDFTNAAGIRVQLTLCLEPSPVPLQFVAADGRGLFISGAVTLTGPVEPADSLAPVLDDLYGQLSATLQSIERR